MQAGSYLLNNDWEQVYTDQAAFVRQWRWAEQRNDLNSKTIERVLKQTQRQRYKAVKGGGQKFLNDLHTEVEQGWTGAGQTNRLLGRIAMREYIFGHVLRGGEPLTGPALVDAIVEVAVALPGYAEWCRHQHEIHKLARDWARDIETSSKYYPYDPNKRRQPAPQLELQPQNNIVSFNQKSALDAAQRIQAAITQLKATDNLPSGTTARADAIIAIARCSNQTLHKHKALWHPGHTETGVVTLIEAVTAPSKPVLAPSEASLAKRLEHLPEESLHSLQPNKFVLHPAAPSGQAERSPERGGSGGFSTGQAPSPTQEPEKATTKAHALPTKQAASTPSGESNPASPSPLTGAAAAIAQRVTEKQQRQAAAHLEKMTRWLELGDPILVKEAQAWFAARAERTRSRLAVEETDPGG